jgi:LPS export ABC transporter protein LptC
MNKTSLSLLIATAILIASGAYYFFRDVPVPPPAVTPTVQETQSSDSAIQFLGSALSQSKDGKVLWELNAEQIAADAERKFVNLTNIQAHIYQNGDQGKIQLTAPQGQVDTTSSIITMQGGMKAVSDKGAEFAGNLVKWFTKEQKFIGEGNILYRQKDITVTGDKIESDQDFKIIRVHGNARAELRRERP